MTISLATFEQTEEQKNIKTQDWYEWGRYSKKIYANELADLSIEELIQLRRDIKTDLVSVNSYIEELVASIRACTEHQILHRESLIARKRKTVVLKCIIRNFRDLAKTTLLAKEEQNKKTPKGPAITLKLSKNILDNTPDQLLNSALDRYTKVALFDLLREFIGEHSLRALELKAGDMALKPFIEWVETEEKVTVERATAIIESRKKGNTKTCKKAGYNSIEDFICAHDPMVNPHHLSPEPIALQGI